MQPEACSAVNNEVLTVDVPGDAWKTRFNA